MTIVDSRLLKGTLVLGGAPGTGTEFACQVTNFVIEQQDGDSEDIVTTLCGDTAGGGTSEGPWHMTGTLIQDFDAPTGMQQWSYVNKGTTQPFTFTPNDKSDLTITGNVDVKFLGIGGDTNTRITRDFDWAIPDDPEFTWPTSGGGAVAATGATSGTPGTFTPGGSTTPANLGALASVTATPATAWATGEYVATADTQHNHWDGAAWAAGDAA
jgi:hypothetical protein